jgi:glycosyltransferase involved in cell wall biosynthesis
MKRVSVMHLIDSLNAGGAERMAVNIVNLLPRSQYRAHLCTTRSEGPLAVLINEDVGRCSLNRKHRFDWRALKSLTRYIAEHNVKILHAHGTALFIAGIASRFPPYPAVVWHDHWGRNELESRPAWLYRIAAKRTQAIIAVNQNLVRWSRDQLGIGEGRVSFISNFVCDSSLNGEPLELPGRPAERIVCVANFRPQKDLLTLINAMSLVVRESPSAHLLLVGDPSDKTYVELIRKRVGEQNLSQNVSFMGQRNDVASILRACDIGVLSSASEGLPLSLIEYGWAKLPTVATRVGECAELLDDGRAGIVVSPGAADELANGILLLLRSPERRTGFGESFFQFVKLNYNATNAISKICRIYESILKANDK